MKLIKFFIQFVFFSFFAFQISNAQTKFPKISYRISFGHARVPANSFQDEIPKYGYADQWIGCLNNGLSFESNISLNLPLGFQPYIGLHLASYNEQNENVSLWSKIHLYNFDYPFTKVKSRALNKYHSFVLGLEYNIDFVPFFIKPYIFGELRYQRFISQNYIEGTLFNPKINQTVQIWGLAKLNTTYSMGYSYGMGLKIHLSNFTIIPHIKFIRAKIPVSLRYIEDAFSDPNHYNFISIYRATLTIPKDYTIDIKHSIYNLGVSYNFPPIRVSSLTHNTSNLGLDLEIFSGYPYIIPSAFNLKYEDDDAFWPYECCWIQNLSGIYSIGGRIIFKLRYGINPYIGYNFYRLNEKYKPSPLFWKKIYDTIFTPSTDFSNHRIFYKISNFNFGLQYEIPNINNRIKPFLLCELQLGSFFARTRLETILYKLEESNSYEGKSLILSDVNVGAGFAFGINIPIKKLKVILSPQMKFTNIVFSITDQFSKGYISDLENGKIKIGYIDFNLGIKYQLLQ